MFRLSLDEFRTLTVDDLTPATGMRAMEQAWTRLLTTGSFAGRYQVAGRDGSRFEIVICGLTHVLPGLHLTAFAPADWPEHELEPIDDGRGDSLRVADAPGRSRCWRSRPTDAAGRISLASSC